MTKHIHGHETAWKRFWVKVDAEGDCWEWIATKTRGGYGLFSPVEGTNTVAHRWAWIALVGPIDEGLQLDHLCRNRACCNTDHLQPVSRLQNVSRGAYGKGKPRKTDCRNGHPYQGDNVVIQSGGVRRCRVCLTATQRRAKAKYAQKFALAKQAALGQAA